MKKTILFLFAAGVLMFSCGKDENTGNGGVTPAAQGVKTYTVNGVSFNMIKVDGGTFMMGATDDDTEAREDERPRHSVTLSDYWICETEVTQALWQAVMGGNPSYFRGANLPVEHVSWLDCDTFITKLNQLTGESFRLPTESEWEYAARGGNKSLGYKYSGSNNADDAGWYWRNSGDSYLLGELDQDTILQNGCRTHPVKTKAPNELGLYDMSGNLYEWCSDWYDDYCSNALTDPHGPTTGLQRVCRGGSWLSNAWCGRVSYRFYCVPVRDYYFLGFRLAFSAE